MFNLFEPLNTDIATTNEIIALQQQEPASLVCG